MEPENRRAWGLAHRSYRRSWGPLHRRENKKHGAFAWSEDINYYSHSLRGARQKTVSY